MMLHIWFISLWLLWLLVGTLFYANELDISYAKGFYMAVNVGYRYECDRYNSFNLIIHVIL